VAAQLYVKIIRGPAAGKSFSPTAGSPLIFGRDPSCAVAIADGMLSRRHLELSWDGETAIVRDLDSSNGTRVNGASIHSAPLASGDTVDAGATSILIEIVELPDAPPVALATTGIADGLAVGAAGAAAVDVLVADGTPSSAPAPPAVEAPVVRLRIVAGPRKDATVRVERGERIVIGRARTCTVPIGDDALSGEHFELHWDGRTCRVRDRGSGNGTYVNEARVREALLRDGDTIEAGLSRFVVALPAPAAAEAGADAPTAAPTGPDAPPGDALILKVIGGRHTGAAFTAAPNTPCVVGRGEDATIRLDDLSLSGRHFELIWNGLIARCRDLGSANGTTVDGERIRTVLLRDRAEIAAGGNLFLVRLPAGAASAAADAPAAAGETPTTAAAAAEPEALEHELRCVVFKVLRGGRAGEMLVAPPVARVVVGRDTGCQVCLDDHEVSGKHFELVWSDPDWRVHDLGSANGTKLNGVRISDAVVHDRDEITLGRAQLLVRLPQIAPPPEVEPVFPLPVFGAFADTPAPPAPPVDEADALLTALRAGLAAAPGMRLYAVIDGAQAVELAVIARQLGHAVFTLFSGAAAGGLAHVGPCLVVLDDAAPFLPRWRAACGRNAGILLQSEAAPEPLSAHLRQIFVVTDESNQEFFFRYYDPRVLRVFLPTCTGDELRAFFGPVTRWIAEDAEAGAYVAFSVQRGALRTDRIGGPAPADNPAAPPPSTARPRPPDQPRSVPMRRTR